MSELFTTFGLGSSAILTNACLLPLYPGLIAFLAGNIDNQRAQRNSALLGVIVLAGVLTMMLVVGFMLYLLKAPFSALLPVLLPIIYLTVITLGIMLLFGYNPFTRVSGIQAPLLGNPYFRAYVYGLLLGPMTLPCTGPLVTSVFVLGVGSSRALLDGVLYFLAFGLGFGWPLVLLPLLARPIQQRWVRWLNRNHLLLTRISALLLVLIGVFGLITEYLPNL